MLNEKSTLVNIESDLNRVLAWNLAQTNAIEQWEPEVVIKIET